MPDINRALTIPGWMLEAELTWLADQASQHQRIVEVGSFLGRSTRALGDNTPGVVFSVDIWNFFPELSKAYMVNGGGMGVLGHYLSHVGDLVGTKIIPIQAPSVTASQLFPTPVFDMIFIDGAHDFYNVISDICCWSKTLQAGGLLCGHDLNWDSVELAVKSLIPSFHAVPETNIWYCHLDKVVVPQHIQRLPHV